MLWNCALCVCVCEVRTLPLLIWDRCGYSISQLLERTDAAVLFEFNSQHLLLQHAPHATWEGSVRGPSGNIQKPVILSFSHRRLLTRWRCNRRKSCIVMVTDSDSSHITFDPHIHSAPGRIDTLASCCWPKFFPESKVLRQHQAPPPPPTHPHSLHKQVSLRKWCNSWFPGLFARWSCWWKENIDDSVFNSSLRR